MAVLAFFVISVRLVYLSPSIMFTYNGIDSMNLSRLPRSRRRSLVPRYFAGSDLAITP